MHSAQTKNLFLQLRLQGLSYSRIARQLGVSKPTLLAWNRQLQPALASQTLEARRKLFHDMAASGARHISDLERRLSALRHELLSRSLREVPTPALEQLAGELQKQIHHLRPSSRSSAPASATPQQHVGNPSLTPELSPSTSGNSNPQLAILPRPHDPNPSEPDRT